MSTKTSSGKRPMRSLSAAKKLYAIQRVHKGESKASVARDIGVPESTLRGWCKNEDKISYLSRQSSPETDESAPGGEPLEKKPKLEDVMQPYNLSKKTSASTHSPGSDFGKEYETSKLLLNVKTEDFKANGRNRAKLGMIGQQYGLNQPETFSPGVNGAGNGMSDLSSSLLIAHYTRNFMMQQQSDLSIKVTAPADTSSGIIAYPGTGTALTPLKAESPHKQRHSKASKLEKSPPLEDILTQFLHSQNSMLGLNGFAAVPSNPCTLSTPTAVTSSTSAYEPHVDPQNNPCFWNVYKQITDSRSLLQQTPDKPILYQQLTKDKDSNSENIIAEEKSPSTIRHTKARTVLDKLLFNNNNNNLSPEKTDVKDEILSQNEALEHGEKFVKWLECCGEPFVTAVQLLQFKSLLNNIKNGADRRNGDLQNKAKVKRK